VRKEACRGSVLPVRGLVFRHPGTISLTLPERLPILVPMAEPVRKLPVHRDHEADPEEQETTMLQQWVLRPDGSFELVETPVTRELFLDPPLEGKFLQGQKHSRITVELADSIGDHLEAKREDVKVISDVKHFFGIRGFAPAPDVSVTYGVRIQDEEGSFDTVKEGARPSLVVEVVSPRDPRLASLDREDKVKLYQRVRIPEYILIEPPRRATGHRYELLGYRLDSRGRYRPIKPDREGRILSETTGLWFTVAPDGKRVVLIDVETGEELRPRSVEKAARKAAEERALREAEARKAAEEKALREAEACKAAEVEIARLREELERLKGSR
jgi:colicin import membrane protein